MKKKSYNLNNWWKLTGLALDWANGNIVYHQIFNSKKKLILNNILTFFVINL